MAGGRAGTRQNISATVKATQFMASSPTATALKVHLDSLAFSTLVTLTRARDRAARAALRRHTDRAPPDRATG